MKKENNIKEAKVIEQSDNEKEKANTFSIFKLCMVTENALKI